MSNFTSNQITLDKAELFEIVEQLQTATTALYAVHQAIESPLHAIMTYDQLRDVLKPLTGYMVRIVEQDLDNSVSYLSEIVGDATHE